MVPLPRAAFSSLLLGALLGCNVDRGDGGSVDDGLAPADGDGPIAQADDDDDGDDDDDDGVDTTAPGDDTGAAPTSSAADGVSNGDAAADDERVRNGLAVNPDSSPDALDAEFAHYEELGVNLIWATAAIDWVCGGGPSCDFTPLDAVVERAEARGWPVVLQVHGSPQWLD